MQQWLKANKKKFLGFSILTLLLTFGGYVKYRPVHCDPIDFAHEARIKNDAVKLKSQSSLIACMQKHNTPGIAIAFIENGMLKFATGFGVLNSEKETTVNADTVFSVGSVSKVINAVLILRLVDAGILDLDVDVNHYLKSWKIKESKFTSSKKITLRHLLSHTAGLTVHGFPDFYPGEELPTVIETLEGKAPAKTPAVQSIFTPGIKMKYSGGGITVSQLVVTDVTGLSYPEAAKKYVFDPLEMKRSTFLNPLPKTHGNIAKAHDRAGKLTAKPRGYQAMPEMAASGLWTSANDLAKFMKALISSYHGESNFLMKETTRTMMTPIETSNAKKIVPAGLKKQTGVGVFLSVLENGETLFSHNGSNESYKALIKGWLESRSAIVILSNGAKARPLIKNIAQDLVVYYQRK